MFNLKVLLFTDIQAICCFIVNSHRQFLQLKVSDLNFSTRCSFLNFERRLNWIELIRSEIGLQVGVIDKNLLRKSEYWLSIETV